MTPPYVTRTFLHPSTLCALSEYAGLSAWLSEPEPSGAAPPMRPLVAPPQFGSSHLVWYLGAIPLQFLVPPQPDCLPGWRTESRRLSIKLGTWAGWAGPLLRTVAHTSRPTCRQQSNPCNLHSPARPAPCSPPHRASLPSLKPRKYKFAIGSFITCNRRHVVYDGVKATRWMHSQSCWR